MKIGIFLEKFTEVELQKDPGIIAIELAKTHQVTIVGNTISPVVEKVLSTQVVSWDALQSKNFWQSARFDVVIVYSWLSLRYNKMLKVLAQAHIKVVLKLDSDGRLLTPFKPSYLLAYRMSGGLKNTILYFIRNIEWSMLPGLVCRLKVQQLEESSVAIIESPMARLNLISSLLFMNKQALIPKIVFVPNPISLSNDVSLAKENRILCVGRWDDPRKNRIGLTKTLSKLQTGWQVTIVGRGSQSVMEEIGRVNPGLALESFEALDHDKLLEVSARVKIFFSSSVSESFGLAAAETLCLGASVVGGPIPSFQYFSNFGKSGTLSSEWKADSLVAALQLDICKWERGDYDSEAIKMYWQTELNPKRVVGLTLDAILNV